MSETALECPYVDYKYYHDIFGGFAIPEEKFLYHENHAETVLHRITFNRILRRPELITNELFDLIRKALCSMAEVDFTERQRTPGIKSENIDGYSVSYSDVGSSSGEAGIAAAMNRSAKIFLSGTGLLFKGRSRKYDL